MSQMKQIDMNGGSLHDQLLVAQSVTDKIKALEKIINPMLLKMKELVEAHNDLVEKHDQLVAEFKMYQATEYLKRASRSQPTHMSVRAMMFRLDRPADPETSAALKFFARQYCKNAGIESQIRKGEKTEGGKSHEAFPIAAAEWAIEQVKGNS